MKKLTAAQQRFFENAPLIAALRLIFTSLSASETPICSIGEIAETTSGGTPDRRESEYYDGNIPWIKSGELNDGLIETSEECITDAGLKNSSAKIYSKGTLVVALYGATVGKIGILTIDAASNQAVCAVTPKTDKICTDYLFWFLRYKRPDFLKSSFGAAQPNISQRVLRETLLPVPSIDLQERICNFLEAIEMRLRGINNVALPDLPSPISQVSYIVTRIEAFAAKIEEARGLRGEAEEASKMLLPSIVNHFLIMHGKHFKKVSLESVSLSITDGDHQPPPKSDTGVAFIFISHIATGKLDLSNPKWVPQEYYYSLPPNRVPKRGDVLYTAVGSYGVPCLVDTDELFCFQRHIAIVKPDRSLIIPEYLVWALSSTDVFNQSTRAATGSAQLTVPLRSIRNLQIVLPPLTEQERIVVYLNDLQNRLNTMKRKQVETSAQLDALLPSVLDKAFKGEL